MDTENTRISTRSLCPNAEPADRLDASYTAWYTHKLVRTLGGDTGKASTYRCTSLITRHTTHDTLRAAKAKVCWHVMALLTLARGGVAHRFLALMLIDGGGVQPIALFVSNHPSTISTKRSDKIEDPPFRSSPPASALLYYLFLSPPSPCLALTIMDSSRTVVPAATALEHSWIRSAACRPMMCTPTICSVSLLNSTCFRVHTHTAVGC